MPKQIMISPEFREKYIQLGLNIAYYRKRAGLTQEELAAMIDISRTYISSIEAPNVMRSFSLEIIFRIAKALDVKETKLFEFRE